MSLNKVSFINELNKLILINVSLDGKTLCIKFKKLEESSIKTCIILNSQASKSILEIDYNKVIKSYEIVSDAIYSYVIDIDDPTINLNNFYIQLISYDINNRIIGRSTKLSPNKLGGLWDVKTSDDLQGLLFETSFPDGVPTLTLLNNELVSADKHLSDKTFLLMLLPIIFEELLRKFIFTNYEITINDEVKEILLNEIEETDSSINQIIYEGTMEYAIKELVRRYISKINLINTYSNKEVEQEIYE